MGSGKRDEVVSFLSNTASWHNSIEKTARERPIQIEWRGDVVHIQIRECSDERFNAIWQEALPTLKHASAWMIDLQ